MIAPYVIARISTPCALVNVNNSTARPSASVPNGARLTLSDCWDMACPGRTTSAAVRAIRFIAVAERYRWNPLITSQSRGVNRQTAWQRVIDLQTDDDLSGLSGPFQGVRRNGDAHELAVGAGFIEMTVVRLRVPAQDAARVRRIVSQPSPPREHPVHANRHRARERRLPGHRIAVGVATGIVKSAPAHVVAVRSVGRIAVLTVQSLRRCFDDERRGGDRFHIEASAKRLNG